MAKSKKRRDHTTGLADRVAPHVETARQKAAPVIAEARDKAAPYVAEARDFAAPAVAEARQKLATEVLPVITAAIAAANEATEEVREEALKRGKATAAALKGEVEAPRRKHRLRRLLVVLGLGGVIAAVAKKLSDRQATTAWQSSYTPAPAAAPETSPGTVGTHRAETADDTGGSSPDVAAADAAAEPRAATTPDDPLEETEVKKTD